jgi:hypothetical protein
LPVQESRAPDPLLDVNTRRERRMNYILLKLLTFNQYLPMFAELAQGKEGIEMKT